MYCEIHEMFLLFVMRNQNPIKELYLIEDKDDISQYELKHISKTLFVALSINMFS